MKPSWYQVARILRSHGLRGELKLDPINPPWNPTHGATAMRLMDRYGQVMTATVENVRRQNDLVLIKFKELSDRETADRFAGGAVEVEASELAELPADRFYVKDIVGMAVIDESGRPLGWITNVIDMPASDVYEVDIDGEKKLIPAVAEFVRHIDVERKQMTVRTIPGLLDNEEDVAE